MKRDFFCAHCLKQEPIELLGGIISNKRYCKASFPSAQKRIQKHVQDIKDTPPTLSNDERNKYLRKLKERKDDLMLKKELKDLEEEMYSYE